MQQLGELCRCGVRPGPVGAGGCRAVAVIEGTGQGLAVAPNDIRGLCPPGISLDLAEGISEIAGHKYSVVTGPVVQKLEQAFDATMREYVEADHVHSLPFGAVASMLAYYARETILNPAYINRSLLDTSSGFVSYYLMKQPHIDIFEYLPWHEVEVERVLQEYKWEYADDAATSWRIGDGTAPFYNYIYYEAAGFTEFDTLRSNQIREGQITREEGLRLIHRDNQPRWESIREYCHLINVSFEDCMRAVNKLPKLYDRAGATRT